MPISQQQLGTVTIQAPRMPWLGLSDVCKVFGKNEKTIKEWVKKGMLPSPLLAEDGTKVWTSLDIGVAIARLQVFCKRAPDAE